MSFEVFVPFEEKSKTYYLRYGKHTDNRSIVNEHSLSDNLHFWLKDHNIEYDLKYNKPKGKDNSCGWIEIHMLKKEHLMFFKLTWL